MGECRICHTSEATETEFGLLCNDCYILELGLILHIFDEI